MESNSKQQNLPKHPRENGSVFSYLTFSWVLPLLLKGRKKTLELEDLYQPLSQHLAANLGTKLEKSWKNEVNSKRSKNKNPSLMRAGLKVFGPNLMSHGFFLLLIEMCFKVTMPLLLGGILRYYGNPNNSDPKIAYFYAGGLILCSFLNVICAHGLMLSNLNVGMKMRVSACSLIYRKSLRLSKSALLNTTSGQVVNLLSNDVGRFELIAMFVHYLWVGPIETIVIGVLMYMEIGISAIAGILFLLLFIPFQFYLGKKTSQLRLRVALRTDERVRLMNEIIQGIQVIKMYAWEKPFAKVVSMARGREIRAIRFASWIRGILLSFIMFSSRVSIFTSLVMFALLGYTLTAQQAFAVTAYYNVLRQTMTVFFPQAIGFLAETIVSVKRLEKFMLYEELDRDFQNTSKMSENEKQPHENGHIKEKLKNVQEPGINMEKVSAKWKGEASDLTLSNINLRILPHTVNAIIGRVGSGKSSLVQAILGELSINSGKIEVNGKISFASQEAWLFSSSVRQNILFGLPMNKVRYRAVVKACSLTRDFELWPDGDKTIVGERGMSLSGGQKARINLARSVYREADIYLLDDQLSAVDSHVQRHLFENCIKGFLKDKIVIFVTHQLYYLPNVDQIILLDNGKVQANGTYESLRDTGLDFTKLLPEEEDKKAENNDDDSISYQRQFSRSSSNTSRDSKSTNQRHNSVSSRDSIETEISTTERMQVEEKSSEGSISWRHYKAYIKGTGGYTTTLFIAFMFILAQVFASAGDYFLTYWVSKEEERSITELTSSLNETVPTFEKIVQQSNDSFIETAKYIFEGVVYDRNIDIYIFSALTVGCVIITLSRSFMFFNVTMKASRRLHDAMFSGISHATMYFFNTNPSGRILNRFSKDIGQIDEVLPMTIVDVLQIFLSLSGIIIVVAIVNPYTLIPTFFIAILFYFMRSFYLKSSRNIKRIDATTRSPIFSHLSATLNGLSTIRAFNAEEILTKEFDSHQDLNSTAFYLFLGSSRAFGFWLDFTLCIYIALVILSFFIMGNSGGNVGLAITQVMGLTGMLQWGLRQSAELENNMTAVERVVEYQSVDPEPDFESKPDKKPPKEWPEKGQIKFNKLSLSYYPDMKDKVLKELEFEIKPQEKIGVVGRTGAGKSSIINALFRLSYLDGKIEIDLRDTQQIGLHDLRSKISIIPQEPVLFSNTIRYNLDPFDEFADDKLWSALEEVNLKTPIKEMPAGLNTKITEGGTNFSVGQRQLVCLARAILRENKILVMDEATANVDLETDALIQTTIRNKFADCTLITIAHRLNTIMDSDRILVMDAGKCVEFSSPYELLIKKEEPRVFYKMLKETPKTTFDMLKKIAEETYKKKKTE
ncbi:hypothetical protein PVAND_008920 [Polypedilum vanderplanki]|uniref:Multidrug resistance-associated protein lethal(2)03659 n=1 Tax=Polypedilum vanderplanki TaxID=319348 RepID=A0A9J6CBQ1_POLVA|nr:hypothetical protein PVAND_008920 [Polypedilum vanderplanki]